MVAVGFSFLAMAHVALVLERPQDREHRGVGEVVVEVMSHFRHGGRPQAPERFHDVELAVGEVNGHQDLNLLVI